MNKIISHIHPLYSQLCIILFIMCIGIFVSCSSTSNMPEDELLYRGIEKINYLNSPDVSHLSEAERDTILNHIEETKLEVQGALACPPNGALLGSSSVKTPFPIRLWVYNSMANSKTVVGKWLKNSFGQEWVLMSSVRPELHATVAQNVLKSHGFFHGNVQCRIDTMSNPRKAKVVYDVKFNDVSLMDSIKRIGFPADIDSIMEASRGDWHILQGTPFCINDLEAERTRLCNLLRNNGYFYYQKDYIVYTADSVSVPGKVLLHISPAPHVPEKANKKWYLGNMRIIMKNRSYEQITDSVVNRYFTLLYHEKRPMKPGIILRDISLRKGQLFNYDSYQESLQNLQNSGLFSSASITFTPREDSDTLDITNECVFEKPYDVTFEAGLKGNSKSRLGPNLSIGLTKRNAFHAGERLSFSIFGDYQWQLNGDASGDGGKSNYYLYGMNVSLEFPRLETPFGWFTKRRTRFYTTPKTEFNASYNVQNRPSLYKYITLSTGVKYTFQKNARFKHEISPFDFDYSFIGNTTARYDSLVVKSRALFRLENTFVPKMSYTLSYNSLPTAIHPLSWRIKLTEASNLLNLGYAIAGKGWNEKYKILIDNPFSQFLKLEGDLTKRWRITENSRLVWHVNVGCIYMYGNSNNNEMPYSEALYVGGANSLRAFPSHGIGPGGLDFSGLDDIMNVYDLRVGSLKFETNLEYRFRILGGLHGALFADAGNVWLFPYDNPYEPGSLDWQVLDKFNDCLKIKFFRQLATDVGLGIRYDFGFLVVRLDWGVAVHLPYDTDKSGYFNVDRFKSNNALHFAIGYPF